MIQLKQDQKRLAVLVTILIAVAIWFLIRTWNQQGESGGRTNTDALEWTSHRLPSLVKLSDEAAAEVTEGSRNPFVFGQPPTPTPNLTPRDTPTPRSTQPPVVRPTNTPVPPGWRPTPVFHREYIGFFGPEYKQVAVFRKATGEGWAEINVAPVGGALPNERGEDTFIIRSIDLESVVIGYVGFPEKEKTRVPLSTK